MVIKGSYPKGRGLMCARIKRLGLEAQSGIISLFMEKSQVSMEKPFGPLPLEEEMPEAVTMGGPQASKSVSVFRHGNNGIILHSQSQTLYRRSRQHSLFCHIG